MKSNYLLLLKIQMFRYWNPQWMKKNVHDKKRRRNFLMALGMAIVAFVVMVYSGLTAYGYIQIGEGRVIPRLMFSVSAWMTFLFVFLKSDGALFGSKDFDLVVSLPINTAVVAGVKVTFSYLVGLLISLLVLGPSLAVYLVFGSACVGEAVNFLLLILTVPCIPVVLALTFGTLILTFASRLPFCHFFSLMLNVALLGGLLLWTSSFSFETKNLEDLADFGQMMADLAFHIYPPADLAVSVLEGRGTGGLFGYLGLSAGLLLLFLVFVGRYFVAIESRLASFRKRRGKKAKVGKENTVFSALYKKELRRLFTSTIYAMNTLVGMFLAVLFGMTALFMGPEKLEQITNFPGIGEQMQTMIPLLLGMLVSLGSTTAPSLSLEGSARWIMCSIPVEPMDIFRAKIAVHISLSLPCVFLSGTCFLIRFPFHGIEAALLFLIPLAYSVFASVFGMYANVKFPSYDWTHEQQAVKNSMSVMISVFGGMFLGLVPLFCCMFLPDYGTWISLGTVAMVIGIAAACWRKLKKEKLFV